MPATEIPTQTLGAEGDTCASCASPLAVDQRYCLECGARRGGPRVPPVNEPASPPAEAPPPAAAARGTEWTPLTAIGLVSVIALILAAGVLIGRGSGGSDDATPQVVRVDGGAAAKDGGAAAGESSSRSVSLKSDWPAGKTGFTIELGVLAKDSASGADVQAAKEDAGEKGAKDVGALDSDEYPSLPAGNWLVYSGVFDTKAEATKALGEIEEDFPDARVVKVSSDAGTKAAAKPTTADTGAGSAAQVDSQQLEELEGLSGDDYVKRSKKLPDDTVIGGAPPPKDNAAPGGGGEAIEIK